MGLKTCIRNTSTHPSPFLPYFSPLYGQKGSLYLDSEEIKQFRDTRLKTEDLSESLNTERELPWQFSG